MTIALPPYYAAQVLVVGDVMLDRYWYGPSRRISPEAPVPIVDVQQVEERPGGAANVAMNIVSLGARVRLIGFTGDDEDGRVLTGMLHAANVDSQLIVHAAYSTLTKLRVIAQNQQLLRIDFERACLQPEVTALLLTHIEQSLSLLPQGVLVLSDYSKGTLYNVQPIIQLGRTMGVPILIDPKGKDFSRYRGATLLTPNLAEFETVVGPCHGDEDQLVTRGMRLMDELQLAALLITRSKQGMTLLRREETPLHFSTQAREICDVTGAGDTVIAVLAASLAAGTPLEDACILANTAAGLVVGKLGTATVLSTELEKSLGLEDPPFGIMNESALKQAVARARQRGERIVMTNGCFDILHAGHVSYLARARQLGDRLIVAVNSDASLRQLKGSGRPINPLGQRMQILSALSSVDWVVPFYEETPERLITEILPDFLVKGGDYLPETIVGAKAVQQAGGEVQVLEFISGCSTTKVIQRILHGTS